MLTNNSRGVDERKPNHEEKTKMSNDRSGLEVREMMEGEKKTKFELETVLPVVASSYRDIIQMLGEDPDRDGLLETPMRAAKAITFFTKGYQETVQEVVKNAVFAEPTDEMVVVKDIEMFR